MTYCVAINLNAGAVFCSDSRTNAGVDNISTYSKMRAFGIEGERQFVVLSAGNLATTQGVIAQLEKDIRTAAQVNLYSLSTLTDAADYIGSINVAVQHRHAAQGNAAMFEASFIFGGQIGDQPPEVHLVYPQGNHITTSSDTPYLQIGESKYGKPILDRILTPDSDLDTAAVCALVSMDSTMRSNLTVGPPIEVLIYRRDSLLVERRYKFSAGSEYLREISKRWDAALKDSFNAMPPITWGDGNGGKSG
ncbi:MAG: peptidase [Gammaproteobacteria bacterium]|nr:peptidase [Gammaproteobacteria bacterium]